MACLWEDNLVVFNYLSTSETWPDKRGDNLVVFKYLSTSETWPDTIKDSYFPDITNNVCSHLMWKKTLFDYLREFCLSQLLIQISFPPQ